MAQHYENSDGLGTLGARAASPSRNGHSVLPLTYDADRALVAARMRQILDRHDSGVAALCAYHLGWADEHGRPTEITTGKMLRPALCLAACRGYGDPAAAVPTAAAIELLHAFSLVHDDIEDGDALRHGRTTLWKLVGVPLALNAGDYLFALATRALHEATIDLPPARARLAFRHFSDAYLRMIEGQHLDIEFERRPSVQTSEYVQMARGKTGAMIGAALALGALCGGADDHDVELLCAAGVEVGLAFQAVDDALAIWGDPARTGKAVGNDLARGKKSLPVALALERGWQRDAAGSLSLDDLRTQLERVGVREAVATFAADHAQAAGDLFRHTAMREAARHELLGMVGFIVTREH